MSSLFAQINQLNQEAQKQRETLQKQANDSSTQPATDASTKTASATSPANETSASKSLAVADINANTNVTSPSDVVTSQSDVTMAKGEQDAAKIARSSKRPAKRVDPDETLGKGSRIDLDKLRTVIEEIAAVKTNAYGFSVRMSQREQADIEEFILDTLRKEGIKGYEVSIAKLMRYAMRYMFRVHPQEFVTALRAALEVEETLSI